MSSVGSGSLLCWVIDPRPISYLERCKLIERRIYDQSNTTLCLATSWEPRVMQFPTDLLTLLCEELSCSSERWSKRAKMAKEAGESKGNGCYPPSLIRGMNKTCIKLDWIKPCISLKFRDSVGKILPVHYLK